MVKTNGLSEISEGAAVADTGRAQAKTLSLVRTGQACRHC